MAFKPSSFRGDFSYTSTVAFAHALRIALATESKLDLAHIADSEACDDGLQQVRKSLALWKLLTENDPPKNRNFFVGYVDASLSFRVSPNVILAPAMHKIGVASI